MDEIVSRTDAISLGLTTYFTGKKCKHGHISRRSVVDCSCIICKRLQCKKYYNANSEQLNIKSKQYKSDHIDQIVQYRQKTSDVSKQYSKQWYQNNIKQARIRQKRYSMIHADILNQNSKRWRDANPHKVREQASIRRTKTEQQIPSWYEEDLVKQVYLKRDELNKKWGTNFVVDHIIPLNPRDKSVSGLHCWMNLQLLDASLNLNKGSGYETNW